MLNTWITQSNRKRSEIAAALGITASFLSLLENGHKTPSLALAVRIEALTGGRVPVASWVAAQPEPTERS